jgi:hypothetical protein
MPLGWCAFFVGLGGPSSSSLDERFLFFQLARNLSGGFAVLLLLVINHLGRFFLFSGSCSALYLVALGLMCVWLCCFEVHDETCLVT